MDKKFVEAVISTLIESGNFSDLDICEVKIKLEAEAYRSKHKAEELRLHFTDLFLRHPNMLTNFSYKEIIRKAAEFTEEYLKYE